jgi:hypothetical protein
VRTRAFVLVVVSSFLFGWIFHPLWLFISFPQNIPYWLKHFDWLFDPVNSLTGIGTVLTGLIWWQFGGRISVGFERGAIWDVLWKGFAWAELNAYVCTVFWAIAGEGVFRGRDGPSPVPIPNALLIGIAGPLFGVLISVIVGPLYLWMLESIVRKFEPRAPVVIPSKP